MDFSENEYNESDGPEVPDEMMGMIERILDEKQPGWREEAERMAERAKRFPEHFKFMTLEPYVRSVATFVAQYLPAQNMVVAHRGEDGTLHEAMPEGDEVAMRRLIGPMFGIDMDAYESEQADLEAEEAAQHTNPDDPEAHDEDLDALMREFEDMLAEVESEPEDTPLEGFDEL